MSFVRSLFTRRKAEAAPLLGGSTVTGTMSTDKISIADKARAAFAAGDAGASKAAHDSRSGTYETSTDAVEDHGGGTICGYSPGDYIKSIVFGGLDGIITTFAIIASVAGANLPVEVVIVTGFAKLLGDGLAMGFGDCMSEQAEHQHIRGEHKREMWEMENFPEGEISEMIEIYKEKGFSHDEAARIMELLTKNKSYHDYFVEHMLVHELGHMLPGEDDSPAKNGAVTFGSFMFFGSLPLWPYILYQLINWDANIPQFGICIGITALCLFFLGATQAAIVRGSKLKLGFLMVINGGLAAGASYLVGWGLTQAVGVNVCG